MRDKAVYLTGEQNVLSTTRPEQTRKARILTKTAAIFGQWTAIADRMDLSRTAGTSQSANLPGQNVSDMFSHNTSLSKRLFAPNSLKYLSWKLASWPNTEAPE